MHSLKLENSSSIAITLKVLILFLSLQFLSACYIKGSITNLDELESKTNIVTTTTLSSSVTTSTTTTIPSGPSPGVVVFSDGTYSTSVSSSSYMSWTSTSPDVAAFEVCIGSTSGTCDVYSWQSLSASSLNLTVSGLSLTNGTTYYGTLRTKDTSNQVLQTYNGNGFTVDTAAPVAPGFLDDGEHLSSTTQAPLLRWGTSTDSGSGLAKYQLAVGTTQGNTNVMGWTDVVGTNSNFLLGLLTLLEGQTYYPSVRAVDNAGNISAVTMGDGWAVTHSGFKQMAYIKASNAAANSQFGLSMDIDGDTMVVGVPQEQSNQTGITNGTGSSSDTSLAASGAVFVYRRVNNLWQQEAYIKAGYNGSGGSNFGYSVAISGDTIVVGAPYEDSDQQSLTNGTAVATNTNRNNSGAAYIFRRNGVTWAQEAFVKAPVAFNSDYFGWSVDIDRDTVVIGAYRVNSNSTTIINGATADSDQSAGDAGAAYVIVRSGTTWSHQAYLKAPNAQAGDYFGVHVAVSGDTVAVGANGESSASTSNMADNTANAAGAIYIFKRTSTNWVFEQYIKKSSPQSYDNFGLKFVMSGDYLISSGNFFSYSAYFYRRDNGVWNYKQTIAQTNSSAGGGIFGKNYAIYGNLMVTSDYSEKSLSTSIVNGSTASSDNSGTNVGAAYVYKLSGAAGVDPTWSQIAYLKPSNAVNSMYFGSSVGISNNFVVVGSYGEASSQNTITNGSSASTDTSAANAGAAYVFDLNQSVNPQQMAYVKSSAVAGLGETFGNSVDIDGDTMAVGAPSECSSSRSIINGTGSPADCTRYSSGAVFIYKRINGLWTQEAVIKSSNADSGDNFGSAISLFKDTLVVGAPNESSNVSGVTNGAAAASSDNSTTASGAVYVYRRNNGIWAQEAYIKAPAGHLVSTANLGRRLSLYGDWLAIGDPLDDTVWNNAGVVYLYKRTGSTWAYHSLVSADNAWVNFYFGNAVQIYKDTLVVGSYGEQSNSTTIVNGGGASSTDRSYSLAGAVYVYVFNGSNWVKQAYIKPSYQIGHTGTDYMYFGEAVKIYENTLVVDSKNESTCANQSKFVNPLSSGSSYSSGCLFHGAVFIFERNNSAWTQKEILKSPIAQSNSSAGFGASNYGYNSSLSVASDILLVGHSSNETNGNAIQNSRITNYASGTVANSGIVYVYRKRNSKWELESTVKPNNNYSGIYFGDSIATDGVHFAVGAPWEFSAQTTINNSATTSSDTSESAAGAVYIYSAK